jgi:hypothetical protein
MSSRVCGYGNRCYLQGSHMLRSGGREEDRRGTFHNGVYLLTQPHACVTNANWEGTRLRLRYQRLALSRTYPNRQPSHRSFNEELSFSEASRSVTTRSCRDGRWGFDCDQLRGSEGMTILHDGVPVAG